MQVNKNTMITWRKQKTDIIKVALEACQVPQHIVH